MNLHEYQARKLFIECGIPVPSGAVAASVDGALAVAAELGGKGWVVKAQVHSGGRGKAGGVKLANSVAALEEYARTMLSSQLVTKQSAPDGQPVNRLLIQEQIAVAREFYLGFLVDRSRCCIAIIVSKSGGTDIEEVAAKNPSGITTVYIHPLVGLQQYQCRHIARVLELNNVQEKKLAIILGQLHQLFIEKDLSLLEINPLVLDKQGKLLALDAKITVDDSALFRQAHLAEWRDPSQENEKERMAKYFDLSYIALDGNIGCMVNGAGLAMATMDIIRLYGGDPANFLDVGGNATADRVAKAFWLISSDQKVRSILINIFGGIVRCDLIAEGVIQAIEQTETKVPIIVRLQGSHMEEGKKALQNSSLSLVTTDDLDDAAKKAVAAASDN